MFAYRQLEDASEDVGFLRIQSLPVNNQLPSNLRRREKVCPNRVLFRSQCLKWILAAWAENAKTSADTFLAFPHLALDKPIRKIEDFGK